MCAKHNIRAKGTHCLKNAGLVTLPGRCYGAVIGPKFPRQGFSSWLWSPGLQNRTPNLSHPKVRLVPWHVSMAPPTGTLVREVASLGSSELPRGLGLQLIQGNFRVYDLRQHLSFWGVALSRVHPKAAICLLGSVASRTF